MNYYMKIASCSADGKLKVTTQLFDHMNWDSRLNFFYHAKGMEYYEALLAFALYRQQHGYDDEAIDTYTRLLDETVKNRKPIPEYAYIAYQAYCGLSAVTFRSSDYVWESNLGTVEMYREIFEKSTY